MGVPVVMQARAMGYDTEVLPDMAWQLRHLWRDQVMPHAAPGAARPTTASRRVLVAPMTDAGEAMPAQGDPPQDEEEEGGAAEEDQLQVGDAVRAHYLDGYWYVDRASERSCVGANACVCVVVCVCARVDDTLE